MSPLSLTDLSLLLESTRCLGDTELAQEPPSQHRQVGLALSPSIQLYVQAHLLAMLQSLTAWGHRVPAWRRKERG